MKDKRKPANKLKDTNLCKKGYVTIIMYTKARTARTVTISQGCTLSHCTGSRYARRGPDLRPEDANEHDDDDHHGLEQKPSEQHGEVQRARAGERDVTNKQESRGNTTTKD